MIKEISFNTKNRKFSVSQTLEEQKVRDYKGRKIEFDAEICSSLWSKFMGLMFRGKNTSALIFIFKKPTKTPIHSFFCPKFLVVWLDDKDKVIEIKEVKSWKLNIKPKRNFVKLVEIPINEKYRDKIKALIR